MNMMLPVDTAVTVPVNIAPLIDDGDFKTREGSVAYNASGMDLVWNFMTTAGVLTQTAVTPTTSGDYDWSEMGDAMYKIEIPASGGASINNDTEGWGWFSGVITGILPFRGPTIAFVPAHVVNGLVAGSDYLQVDGIQLGSQNVGLSSDNRLRVDAAEWNDVPLSTTNPLPNAAPDAAGGLPISDAGGLDLDAQIGTKINDILTDTGTTLDGKINTIDGIVDDILLDTAEIGAAGAGLTEAGGTGDHLTALATQASVDALPQDNTDCTLADAEDVYHADIELTIDGANTQDEYTVTWFRNGVRQTTGITSPTIQVVKRADGTDLIASAAMTQIGSTGSYKYDEDTNRITNGEAVLVLAGATINGGARTFSRLLGRDSSS